MKKIIITSAVVLGFASFMTYANTDNMHAGFSAPHAVVHAVANNPTNIIAPEPHPVTAQTATPGKKIPVVAPIVVVSKKPVAKPSDLTKNLSVSANAATQVAAKMSSEINSQTKQAAMAHTKTAHTLEVAAYLHHAAASSTAADSVNINNTKK